MRITPIEIRQRQFEKKFRGFDIDEVSTYLNTLSNEWERLIEENKELKRRFENAEREVQKLREVESTLYKTLKTAEDTGNNIIDQANKKAELTLREAQLSADKTIKEANEKAQKQIEDAELNARNTIESAREELKDAQKELKEIENKKASVLEDLKNISADISSKLEKYTKPPKIELYNKFMEEPVTEAPTEVAEPIEEFQNEEPLAVEDPTPTQESDPEGHIREVIDEEQVETYQQEPSETPSASEPKEEAKFDAQKGSFFDQI